MSGANVEDIIEELCDTSDLEAICYIDRINLLLAHTDSAQHDHKFSILAMVSDLSVKVKVNKILGLDSFRSARNDWAHPHSYESYIEGHCYTDQKIDMLINNIKDTIASIVRQRFECEEHESGKANHCT